ncbi:hypothetical protein PDN23_14210 [Bacillus cereus]|nr:hypothetical protein [Bacillus cereus]
MYKVPWLDKMEKLIGSYHKFVLELLKCINKLSPLEKPIEMKKNELEIKLNTDLKTVVRELENLKVNKECSDDFFKVATRTDLKKHLRNLKYEEYDVLKKYINVTNNYEGILSDLYIDQTKYSKSLKQAFVYLYENLLSGKFFNKAIESKGKVAVNEFKNFLTLENNICPYCDWYEMEFAAVSIDHFLPKSKYPLLSIYPRNLVVACAACNDRIKKDNIYLPIAHPYYNEVADFFNFRLDNNEIVIEFKNGITLIDKRKVSNFLKLFDIKERFNRYHVKKLNVLIREIRQDVYEELKDNKVKLEDVEKSFKYKIKKEQQKLFEHKRQIPLTKLKIDYLNQINTLTEIKELAEYVLWDIELYQKSME